MGIIEIIKGSLALLFLQSSWSYNGRQTLGVLFAVILLAKNQLGKNRPNITQDHIKERLWQKFSFNTNPYCTGVILGIALNEQGEIFKDSYFTLEHIFGAVGDEFFWRTFRPALLSLTIIILLIGYSYSHNFYNPGIFVFAPFVFLIPYNFVAQGIRFLGLHQGKKLGKQAALFLIQALRTPTSRLYNLLAFTMGMLLIMLPLIVFNNFSEPVQSVSSTMLISVLIIPLVVLSYLALRTERASSYLLMGGLLIFLIIKLL